MMDTELVSLMGLAIIVRLDVTRALRTITVSQLALSLYLMTQYQTILAHPLTSLLQTADLIDASFRSVSSRRIFDGPILQLSRKLLVRTIISHGEGQGPMQATFTPTQDSSLSTQKADGKHAAKHSIFYENGLHFVQHHKGRMNHLEFIIYSLSKTVMNLLQ